MKIALVGYGKMGKMIEQVCKEKNLNVVSIIDKFDKDAQYKELNSSSLKDVDVAIDFTFPEAVNENIKKYIDNNVNVVMGTTGWYGEIENIKKLVNNKIGFIWSGNFSIGVNIFFRIIKASAGLIGKFKDYDAMLYELHHNQKKDSPSGTAQMIGKILLEQIPCKTRIVEDKLDRKIESNEIHLASVRGGNIPGTHTVIFDSAADTIELKHEARNRQGMATGAVLAAEWIKGKKGFFNIDDMMNSIL